MKFKFIVLFVFIILFSGCDNPQMEKTNSPILFSTLQKEKIIPLFEEKEKQNAEMKFNISINAIEPANRCAEGAWLNKFILSHTLNKKYESLSPTMAISAFIRDEGIQYKKTWIDIFEEFGESASANNFINITANQQNFFKGNILVYKIYRNEFLGGAHGLETTSFYNIDLKTKKLLTLKDIFKEEYIQKLTDLLIDKAILAYKVKNRKKLFEICNPLPTENFAIQENSILFYFNHYEIACYAVGPIALEISYKELNSILKESFKKYL